MQNTNRTQYLFVLNDVFIFWLNLYFILLKIRLKFFG